jgi:hypothetical protein
MVTMAWRACSTMARICLDVADLQRRGKEMALMAAAMGSRMVTISRAVEVGRESLFEVT